MQFQVCKMSEKYKTHTANLNTGHRQRLRERFISGGIKSFVPHEILELLLTYAIPQRDVKPLAKELLKRFGNISGVLSAPLESLTEHPGIKENSAVLLKLIHDLHLQLLEQLLNSNDLIANPQAAVNYLREKIGNENREVLAIIFLDSQNHAIGYEWFPGGNHRVQFYPQNIARSALLHQASGVIAAHNHPNGSCKPSDADLNATRILKDYLESLDLKLVDHLIITKNSHLSLLIRMGCIFKNYTDHVIDPERRFNRINLPKETEIATFTPSETE